MLFQPARLVAAAAARTATARIDEDEHDRDDDREGDPGNDEPASAAPTGSHLIFTECGHEPLLPCPVRKQYSVAKGASPERARAKPGSHCSAFLSKVKRPVLPSGVSVRTLR